MRTISTGQPSTLKTYREMAFIMSGFDDQSAAVQFFDKKIAEQGENQEVIRDEREMLYLIWKMVTGDDQDIT